VNYLRLIEEGERRLGRQSLTFAPRGAASGPRSAIEPAPRVL